MPNLRTKFLIVPRHRVVSLVTHADIPDIVWADDETATHPPAQRLIDMTDTQYNGLTHYDSSLYTSLAGMLNEEPVQPRDLQMMGMLLPLGIEKGTATAFKSDAATVAQLNSASAAAHAWLVAQSITAVTPWWPKSQWVIPVALIGVKTLFHWETPNYFDVDSRGIALSTFFGPTATLGGGSFYLATYHDSAARPLDGGRTYRFHLPANVPVSQFWAVTVYSLETSALLPNSTRLTVSSLDKGLSKNADGSADLYFGPTPPCRSNADARMVRSYSQDLAARARVPRDRRVWHGCSSGAKAGNRRPYVRQQVS